MPFVQLALTLHSKELYCTLGVDWVEDRKRVHTLLTLVALWEKQATEREQVTAEKRVQRSDGK